MPLAELVRVVTSGRPLDGLLYRSDAARPRGGALLMHGNMRNFYTGPVRFLPPYLVPQGYDCFAFNRRAHDILTADDDRRPEGGAFQITAEGMEDNEHAAGFLAELGHRRPIVIGHSNGGMLGTAFAASHPETRALVLLSAHAGASISRDLARRGQMGGVRHEELVHEAEELVEQGRGDELLLMPGWWYAIAARSLLDRERAMPSTVDMAARVECPCLLIKSADEPEHLYPSQAFAERTKGPCAVELIPGASHYYHSQQAKVAGLVADWLHDVLPAGAGDA
ncbi:MAG: alpha/beta fold hydrolase [Actinobacteria bacterium]|nr:alpha/beta fold hydrolase [Actinomycetota bacterium]